jgi:bacterioferritin-associated ferredoxin
MSVCLCNASTDAQLRAAATPGAARFREVHTGCGCESQWGCCTASV